METGTNHNSYWAKLSGLAGDHSGALDINSLHRQWGCSKEVNTIAWTTENQRVDNHE